uniref:ROK family protein n=1 Tax=Mariniphaga sediminis TaxID=1628158 RepID=UPI003563D249
MDLQKKLYLIIDAGGTYFKSAIADAEAEILPGSTFQTRSWSEGPAVKIMNAYRETISFGLDCIRGERANLSGIGIATPGPFDYKMGMPLMKHKFSAIYGLKLPELIYKMPGMQPEIPICFMHDANAALAGEIWKGNARGFDNTALVTLGTGLGFAFSENGEVRYNTQGGPARSIFTLPYGNGVLEDYVSKRGILKMYQLKSGKLGDDIKVSDIGKWANGGDIKCIEIFKEVGSILAKALYEILDQKGIQCLLFGGQISRSFHHMEESLKAGLEKIKSLQKISEVKNIEHAALLGVLWKIMNI